MPKKAIFAQTEQIHWVEVAAKLRDRYGWEICYFVGGMKEWKKAAVLFPSVIFHLKSRARNNEPPKEFDQSPSACLDKNLISALSFHESIFMKMLDRDDYDGSLSYRKRIESYHFQVMYWKGVLEHFNPDVVVFRIAPHTGYDYVLYALCRVMNISTVMFERTSLPGTIYPVTSFEDGSEIIRKRYAQELKAEENQHIELSVETQAHLEKLAKTFSEGMPFHLKYKLANFKKGGEVGGNFTIIYRLIKDLITALLYKKKKFDYLQKRYYESIGLFKRKKLLSHYNRLATQVDLKFPYIFVALQCEPERQTCPSGGVFGHQYLMIDLLSKLIPEGWKLYVKEHVSQFKDYQTVERSKSYDFYDRIASKTNVQLVPLSYNSFDLIDKSMASATVSGTVGWESVVRGKPALLFGYSWYRDCEGVFVTHTVDECKSAINKIINGYHIDKNKFLRFVKSIESCSIRGFIDKYYEKTNIISAIENIENEAKAIHEFLKN